MLAERDPNSSGRASRASNLSAMSRATGRHPHNAGKDDPLGRPGVMSMLRTTTEMGNVSGLTSDFSGMAGVPRAPQRRGPSSRLSTASSLSNHSSRASRHHRQRPSSSSAARQSMREPQYLPDTLSPTMMNLPASSPLIPQMRDRDGNRSLSMTNTMQPMMQPTPRLSSNRSLGSLRHRQVHSPYAYPPRLGASGYRPASPALSDIVGPHPSRLYSNGSHGHPHLQHPMRFGNHSETSMTRFERQERAHVMARMPSRGPSPVYYAAYGPDIPPVPSVPQEYRQHVPVAQIHLLERSTKGSVSSGSINLRMDPDTPSSEAAGPRTPKDGASMEVLVSPDGTQVLVEKAAVAGKGVWPSNQEYYDYSEPFHRGQSFEPEINAVSTGFVNRIKTIMEETAVNVVTAESTHGSGAEASNSTVSSAIPGIAELPASPVPRRITRDLIKEGLGPASSTGEMALSERSTTPKLSELSESLPIGEYRAGNVTTAEASLPAAGRDVNRHSILSQADSSVLDSSTLDFAVRYSIPMATKAGLGTESEVITDPVRRQAEYDAFLDHLQANVTAPQSATTPAEDMPAPGNRVFRTYSVESGGLKRYTPSWNQNSNSSPGTSTGDGMSDLIAGYQRTETRVGEVDHTEVEPISKEESALQGSGEQKPLSDDHFVKVGEPEHAETKSNHGQKSSDQQSFKSCTDVPDVVSKAGPASVEKEKDLKAIVSLATPIDKVVPRESSVKDSDARSFRTAKDAVTPESGWSMPSRLPSSSLVKRIGTQHPSMSEDATPSSPPVAVLRKPVPHRDPSESSMASKPAMSSKHSVKQSSPSLSGSSSTLNARPFAPIVPPRESSTSKEAQRFNSVGSFLMRQYRRTAGLNKSQKQVSVATSSIQSSWSDEKDVITTPKKVLHPEGIVSDSYGTVLSLQSKSSPSPSCKTGRMSPRDRTASEDASPAVPKPSSVYSIEQPTVPLRIHSSPVDSHESPQIDQRDSQSTTNLAWPSGKTRSLTPAVLSASLMPVSEVRESTTTDLRMSQYRYAGPSRDLPDLKEESHEDSSLNTSVSNLKHSSFRFPGALPGMPAGVRVSNDNAAMYSRRSSTGSQPRGAAGKARIETNGLPHLEVSSSNLWQKCCDALGFRSSRSSEDVAGLSRALEADSPLRSASAGAVMQRDQRVNESMENTSSSPTATGVTKSGRDTLRGARSPDRYVAEVEQVTIPSIGPLTERITKWLPSFRSGAEDIDQGEFPEQERIEQHAMEQLQDVRPAQKRSSARLRALPGSPELVVIDDYVYQELTGKNEKNHISDHQSNGAAKDGAGEAGGSAARGGRVPHTPPRPTRSPSGLDALEPALLRPRALTTGHRNYRASGESALSSTRSLRSSVSTPTATETRPWNSDKNYPWASTKVPSVDIALPLPRLSADKSSPRPGPSHLRNTLSSSSSIVTTSSFSSTCAEGTATPRHISYDHAQRHRFSSIWRSVDQPHIAGERYPTSALAPPTAIFRDDIEASDTSDDEDFNTTRKPRIGLIKRLSSARNADFEHPRAVSTKPSPQLSSHRHTFREAKGLTKTQYYRQRFTFIIKDYLTKGVKYLQKLSKREY